MSKLETVVRPFQAAEVFTARVAAPPPPPAALPGAVELIWGDQISLMAKQNGIPDLNTGGKHWSEADRTTRVVRVSNPNDATQFVDVEKILNMRFKDEVGNEHFLQLNN